MSKYGLKNRPPLPRNIGWGTVTELKKNILAQLAFLTVPPEKMFWMILMQRSINRIEWGPLGPPLIQGLQLQVDKHPFSKASTRSVRQAPVQ